VKSGNAVSRFSSTSRSRSWWLWLIELPTMSVYWCRLVCA
jgi:hypothetical protein